MPGEIIVKWWPIIVTTVGMVAMVSVTSYKIDNFDVTHGKTDSEVNVRLDKIEGYTNSNYRKIMEAKTERELIKRDYSQMMNMIGGFTRNLEENNKLLIKLDKTLAIEQQRRLK